MYLIKVILGKTKHEKDQLLFDKEELSETYWTDPGQVVSARVDIYEFAWTLCFT